MTSLDWKPKTSLVILITNYLVFIIGAPFLRAIFIYQTQPPHLCLDRLPKWSMDGLLWQLFRSLVWLDGEASWLDANQTSKLLEMSCLAVPYKYLLHGKGLRLGNPIDHMLHCSHLGERARCLKFQALHICPLLLRSISVSRNAMKLLILYNLSEEHFHHQQCQHKKCQHQQCQHQQCQHVLCQQKTTIGGHWCIFLDWSKHQNILKEYFSFNG